ncbi:unnamed protein product [Lymnaea stagnalis]|uniref:MYND-type domain-containing protein n=1 Tax=Lymnaea stagnalis TaxID=6523 RepID=A0AAV2I8A0_LYMST
MSRHFTLGEAKVMDEVLSRARCLDKDGYIVRPNTMFADILHATYKQKNLAWVGDRSFTRDTTVCRCPQAHDPIDISGVEKDEACSQGFMCGAEHADIDGFGSKASVEDLSQTVLRDMDAWPEKDFGHAGRIAPLSSQGESGTLNNSTTPIHSEKEYAPLNKIAPPKKNVNNERETSKTVYFRVSEKRRYSHNSVSDRVNKGQSGLILKETDPCKQDTGGVQETVSSVQNNTEHRVTVDSNVAFHPPATNVANEAPLRTHLLPGPGEAKEEKEHLEQCSYCLTKKETMLKCLRCRTGRYCDRICQRNDYSNHKTSCKRAGRFLAARGKIPVKWLSTMENDFKKPLSTALRHVPSHEEYRRCGSKKSIMLEIRGKLHHPFLGSVEVMDEEGQLTSIFYFRDMMIENANASFPIEVCLIPGNFMILTDFFWEILSDGTLGILVHYEDEVYFVSPGPLLPLADLKAVYL